MGLTHDVDPKRVRLYFWLFSILFIIIGIEGFYSIYTRGITSLSLVIGLAFSILSTLVGSFFILNDLHFVFIWEPRENKRRELALKSAMIDITELIQLLGYDNWQVTNPDEFNIRFEYITKGNVLADFKLHTHTITASYADYRYKLWFKGYYVGREMEHMINPIVRKLSNHFKHEYDINGLRLRMQNPS